MWFNAKYTRAGPLFQGRFKGILVDSDERWLLDLSLYIHLNPVRVKRLGLDKQGKQMESRGWTVPSPDVVRKRLATLRAYRWSSYPFYAGYKRTVPSWLAVTEVREMVASTAYRRLAEDRIAHGFDEGFASRLKDRVALGAEAFVERMRGMCVEDSEYEAQRMLRHRIGWGAIVEAVEQAKGRPWTEFAFKRGDWGRAAVYHLARQYGGLTLSEIGDIAGGVKYHAVSKLLKRFEMRLRSDVELTAALSETQRRLNV